MSKKILFIFEGENTEEQIVLNMQRFFLNEDLYVKCIYGGEIYQVYKEILADKDLDTFNLIKERNNKNKELLKNYSRNDFAEIYMFFDYDGHSSLADDEKLKQLLDFFNEETENGKLYISYPMVESLKHIISFDSFKELTAQCKYNIKYKGIVANEAFPHLINFTQYDLNIWKLLINTHLKKMNYIVNDSFTFPNEVESQSFVFLNQLEKYIIPHSLVAVISSFPIFLHDYYGNQEIKRRIE